MSALHGNVVACRHCQHGNSPARRYCSRCGQSLWEACPQCGAECSAEEAFCGACGTDIAQARDQREQHYAEQLAEAQQRADQYDFDGARRLLETTAGGAPEPWQARLRQAIAALDQQRDAQAAAAAAALAEAGRSLAAWQYDQAARQLEAVPEPLRSDEHRALLERARRSREELRTLSGQIRAALEGPQPLAALAPLARLLELKPDHPQAGKLADKLRRQAVSAAKAQLAQHRYQAALDLVHQIPLALRQSDVDPIAEAAEERLCLLTDIEGAALVEPRMLALADRLRKLAPGDATAARIRAELAQRLETPPADARLGAPDWQRPPTRTLLGPAVDWLAHATRTAPADDSVRRVLRDRPGQYWVALGLALEGLGLADASCDLTPPAKRGLWGAVEGWTKGRRAVSACWGIDLGQRAVRAVKLVLAALGQAQIVAVEHVALASSPGVEDEAAYYQAAQAALAGLAARLGEIKGCAVCVALPGLRVLGRFFELPPMPAKKVPAAVRFETAHQLPVELAALTWSFALLGQQEEQPAADAARRVVVQAARELHVRQWMTLFEDAGIPVDRVQSDCVALWQALRFELGPELAGSRPGAVAAIDVGACQTNVVVAATDSLWFRTMALGGDAVTRELAQRLKLTYEQAEQVKQQPARAPQYRAFREAAAGPLAALGDELLRSLAAYQKLFPESPIRRIYGLGGGFQTPGLVRYLRCGS